VSNKTIEMLNNVENYYNLKIREHGLTPKGVDWNGKESQLLRFQQLMKITGNQKANFSVNDLGCGYGALVDFLKEQFKNWNYFGVDISRDMIDFACNNISDSSCVQFKVAAVLQEIADYSVASGIFNVRLKYDDDMWWRYITSTLDMMNESSRLGFAFNCLTKYSDKDKMRDYLYYADPCKIFDWCKNKYSKQVALLHDYDLYEFSILVRKF
jgi:SAM-dependent methyltransferase